MPALKRFSFDMRVGNPVDWAYAWPNKDKPKPPSQEQVDAALGLLLAGETQVEIVLDDWGVGPTRFETDSSDSLD